MNLQNTQQVTPSMSYFLLEVFDTAWLLRAFLPSASGKAGLDIQRPRLVSPALAPPV